jgi:hypothetical protein
MTWQKGCIYYRNTTRPHKINLIHCYQDIIHQHPLSSLYYYILITRRDVRVQHTHKQYTVSAWSAYAKALLNTQYQ